MRGGISDRGNRCIGVCFEDITQNYIDVRRAVSAAKYGRSGVAKDFLSEQSFDVAFTRGNNSRSRSYLAGQGPNRVKATPCARYICMLNLEFPCIHNDT